MKQQPWILGAIAVGIIGLSTACDRGAPTEPAQGVLHPDAASPLGPYLSGIWSGTITFHASNDPEGNDSFAPPCDGPSTTTGTLVQNGANLTGELESCAGVLEIQGVIADAQISGTLSSAAGQSYGRISGTLSANRIRFLTRLKVEDPDDPEGRDNDGDGTIVSSEVDLRRLGPRDSPLVADGPRPPRALATRR